MTRRARRTTGLWRHLKALVCCVLATAAAADAQVITVRTGRIAEGDQSGFLPSTNGGMGRLLTMPDTLLDPFHNPAAGARVRRGHVVGSPTTYAISNQHGGANTLPVGAMLPLGSAFGGLVVAVQRLYRSGPGSGPEVLPNTPESVRDLDSAPDLPGFQSQSKRYTFALLGRTMGRTSLAASAKWSSGGALDGAEVLYPGARGLARRSNDVDVRIGALRTSDNSASLEAVVLATQSWTTHDVSFVDLTWEPTTRSYSEHPRVESDRDRARTVGLHVAYTRPLVDSAWRVGTALTANRIQHVEMPQHGAMTLNRDPGRSSAFNAAVGLSRLGETTQFGIDAVYEPIWSRVSLNGLPNDDRYRFNNSVFRAGASRDFDAGMGSIVRLQLGAQVRTWRYSVDRSGPTQTPTTVRNGWHEWTHTYGIGFIEGRLSLSGMVRMQSGMRRPVFQPQFFGFGVVTSDLSVAPGFPSPTLQVLPVRVATVQFAATLRVP